MCVCCVHACMHVWVCVYFQIGFICYGNVKIWPSYHYGHLIIPSVQVTIPQLVAVNENVFTVNLSGKIRVKSEWESPSTLSSQLCVGQYPGSLLPHRLTTWANRWEFDTANSSNPHRSLARLAPVPSAHSWQSDWRQPTELKWWQGPWQTLALAVRDRST